MGTITKRGYELADMVDPHRKKWGLRELHTASTLCRAAVSYEKIQVAVCNGHPACSSPTLPIATIRELQQYHEEWCEKRDRQLSKRIRDLAKQLPFVKGVVLGGDPRGATVKLVLKNGRTNDWGQEGICVPGS